MKILHVKITRLVWNKFDGSTETTHEVRVFDDDLVAVAAERILSESTLITAVEIERGGTEAELARFLAGAQRDADEIEAQERHGSTKSLPKGWSVGADGRTYNTFDELV